MTTTWKFEGTETWFSSPTDKLERAILTHRKRANDYTTNIIFHDGTTNNSTTPDTTGSNGSASTTAQPTVSVDNKKTKAKSEAIQLQSVHGDVVATDTADLLLEDNPDLSLLDSPGDRLAL
jgi:hypothetical protein